ncbi:glycine zipper 2TM domain-containing protein [Spongiibacter sp. KMU-166]|uniref:Glycine zipper 2TM domain-containing protein n=1 Tax=Spongiibacter thalassae TaxID=2721624 RepID=A0ABX1GJ85_9GAMM|nr:glycine zipper 2TM domain-containing protein [Spongiibacter thalassae]NKI18417.1 glycine zipper 2TM domain-containing protein [Spongiibacter thalassae]
MNNAFLVGGGIALAAITATGSYTAYQYAEPKAQFAEVLAVKPLTETYFVSREECYDEVIQEQAPAADTNQVTGTVIGAIVGAVVGNQVGGGNGKKLATVAGAAAGGYAGKRVQEDMQRKNIQTRTERRCQTLQDPQERVTGYRVTYQLGEQTETIVMDHEPGARIPVKDGELQFDVAANTP